MVLPHVILRLLVAAFLLTGIVFAGQAMAKPGDMTSTAQSTSDGKVSVPAATAAAKPAETPAIADLGTPCTRKVKVVYAGYGEANRASCGATAAKVAAD